MITKIKRERLLEHYWRRHKENIKEIEKKQRILTKWSPRDARVNKTIITAVCFMCIVVFHCVFFNLSLKIWVLVWIKYKGNQWKNIDLKKQWLQDLSWTLWMLWQTQMKQNEAINQTSKWSFHGQHKWSKVKQWILLNEASMANTKKTVKQWA